MRGDLWKKSKIPLAGTPKMKVDGSGVFPFQLSVFEVPFAVKFRGTKQLQNKKEHH